MEVIIKGRRTQVEKETCLNGINESISETLAAGTPDIRRVITSLELTELGFSREEAIQIKKDSIPVLSAEESFRKIKRELGEIPFEISRLDTRENEFEGWMPVGVLGHVTSSNDAMLPFFSSVEGILTGNINVINVKGNTIILTYIATILSSYITIKKIKLIYLIIIFCLCLSLCFCISYY